MTELDTVKRAKMYMDKLARGIDPITDRVLPEDTALNNARLAKCFSYVSGVLDQVIANGGHVGQFEKKEFTITYQQLAQVRISRQPVRITEFADELLRAVGDPEMKRPSPVRFNKWLISKGFMGKELGPDGKNRTVPTEAGLRLGLSTGMRQSPDGDYLAVYYDANAQRYLLDNLFAILQSK